MGTPDPPEVAAIGSAFQESCARLHETTLAPRCQCHLAGDGCCQCRRMLAIKVTSPWVIDCPNCSHRNSG